MRNQAFPVQTSYACSISKEHGFAIYPWRYMSAQCPHNISRMIYVLQGKSLVRCYADAYLQGYMSAQYPSSVLSSGILCGHISLEIYVRTMSVLSSGKRIVIQNFSVVQNCKNLGFSLGRYMG